MNFVTGIVLPQVNYKDAQPLEIVEEQLKSVIAQSGDGSLHEIIEDYSLMHSKRLRARIALDCSKALNVRPKDISAWGVALELINNVARIQEALVYTQLAKSNFSSDEVKNQYESQQAASSFMALLPSIVAQVPSNDGIRMRLLAIISSFYLNYLKSLLDFSVLNQGSVFAEILPKLDAFIQARSALLFELPAQGVAIVGGLSIKESMRMSESFRTLGELQYMIDEALVILENPVKLISEHNVTPYNFLLMGLRELKGDCAAELTDMVKDELVRQLHDTGVLRLHVEKIKAIHITLEKSDSLKPWPKLLEVLRTYANGFFKMVPG
ncbi:MAG: hypothetical protein A4S09_16730 [Proteobacteria bacterium SG_bin7]|nr:MAG: hypothetical protein A4S09_16730 [Proteobacteria bacterium SG_bin7]